MDLDETALKVEIDRISVRIDDIMEKVDRLYPHQELESTVGDNTAKSTDENSGLP